MNRVSMNIPLIPLLRPLPRVILAHFVNSSFARLGLATGVLPLVDVLTGATGLGLAT